MYIFKEKIITIINIMKTDVISVDNHPSSVSHRGAYHRPDI